MMPEIAVSLQFISMSNDIGQNNLIRTLLAALLDTPDNLFSLKSGQGCWFLVTEYQKAYEIDKQFSLTLNFLEKNRHLISQKRDLLSDIVIRFDIYVSDEMPSLFFSKTDIAKLHSLKLDISMDIDIALTA